MAALIGAKDWSDTPLGPIELWPQSLRTTVSLCVASNFPINIIWGPEHTQIYNDGYRVLCGDAHPRALGEGYNVTWASAWPALGTPFGQALAGETTFLENQRMFLTRSGYLEETFFTFSLSPISDESGGIGGLFHPVTETTATMLAERRTRALLDVGAALAGAADLRELAQVAARTAAGFPFDLPFALFYALAPEGTHYELAAHHGVAPGTGASPLTLPADAATPWPLAEAAERSTMIEVADCAACLQGSGCGPYEEPPSQAFVLPIATPGSARPLIVAIAGVSPRLPVDDTYRGFFELLAAQLSAALTTMRAREDERRRAEALAEVDRAETAFFSNVNHEFRTPLTLLPGPLEQTLADADRLVPGASTIRGRVLLADDNADMRAYVARLLAAEGFAVESVADGHAALAAMRQFVPDLILSDVMMPGLDGFSLLTAVRADARLRETPVILLSARAGEEARVEGLQAGADDYLTKPFTARELVARVAATLTLVRGRRDAALRENEEQLRLATEAAEVGLWDVDGTSDALFWPSRVKAMFGISADRPVSMSDFYSGVHPEDRNHVTAAYAAAADPARRVLYDVEYRTIGKEDGILRWVAAKGRGVFDDDGSLVRMIGTAIDITKRKRDEAALRESEAKLRALNADLERQVVERARDRARTWQVSPDLLSVIAPDGSFESVNPAWSATLGWSEGELTGSPYIDFVHPDDIDRSQAAFAKLVSGEPVLRFENRYRCKDGQWRWMSWVAVPEGDKYYCSARDVSAEKAQAAALAERTAERDRLWRHSQDLMVITGTDGMFQAVSPASIGILDYTPEEIVGRSAFDLIHPDDWSSTKGALAQATREALPAFENRYRHRDGSYRWLSWVAAPEGDMIYATARHITAEREQAEALRQAEEQLRQSQKMEAVGQLTGGLAHDFNNLLTGITGSLELLQARLAQGRLGEIERYVVAAKGAAKRAASLTHRLLAFSRRQTLDPKPVRLNGLVTGMEDLVRRSVGPAITVEVALAGGLWTTLIDAGQLENALLNLCINARDAMPDGGRLTIETANKWLDERSARERELPAGQYVTLCVSDTGSGMTAEVIRRAFDPFYTTKPLGLGTGLGLSMVYGFARQSGGQVRLYSELGQGTVVCIYLPRHTGAEEADEAPDHRATEPRAAQGETVVVVDDEPTVRMLIVEVLADMGYEAVEAVDGATGLRILQSGLRVDLLITDVGLPGGMNGRQLADAARTIRPELKVLFITGYAENAVVGNGHLDAGMHVLTKPFAMDALASRIKDILALA